LLQRAGARAAAAGSVTLTADLYFTDVFFIYQFNFFSILTLYYYYYSFITRKAAHNTVQYIKRSSINKREEIKTNTTIKETNVQNKRRT